ncbi:MAG TPA: CvpA family protein [Candidatus Latescibacteria bacterium]|nr:CvpA family protein [Candidatus Latescibacterota bacterium]
MSAQDVVILVIIGVCVLYGLYQGLIRGAFALLSVVLGGIGAAYLHGWVGGWLGKGVLAKAAGFALAFFAVALLVGWVGRTIWRATRAVFLGWLDRLLGGVLGLLVGGVLVAVALGLLTAYVPWSREGIGRARVAPLLLKGVDKGKKLLPKDLEKKFEEGYRKVLKALQEEAERRAREEKQ